MQNILVFYRHQTLARIVDMMACHKDD